MSPQCLPSSFRFIRLTVWEHVWRFHGGHLGYWNATISAILILYVALMPPIRFRLNPTYGLGDVILKFLAGGNLGYLNDTILSILYLHVYPMPPTKFQFNLTYHSGGDVVLTYSLGVHGDRLGYWNCTILAILTLHVAPMPPTKFHLNLTWYWRCRKMWKVDGRRTDNRPQHKAPGELKIDCQPLQF